jgi:VWFA-related protein
MDADPKKGAWFRRAAILVDYGPVNIAGTTFICPIRGVAFSIAFDVPGSITGDEPTEWLNETHFTHYHRFGSTTQMLAGSSAPPDASAAPAASEPAKESPPPVATARAPETQPAEAKTVADEPGPKAEPSSPPAAIKLESEQRVEPPLPASVPPGAPETETASSGVPASEPLAAENVPGGITLHRSVTELLIPVVVRDQHGRAIGGLGRGDFTVFDQGKTRALKGFSVVESSAASTAAPGSAVAAAGSSGTQASGQKRFTIFLFDDRHLDSSDLAIIQKAASKMLDEPLGPTDYAAVLSFSGANSGITRERSLLQATIDKLTVHRSFQHDTHDCPDIDYYAANKILNQHDEMEFQLAVAKVSACNGGGGKMPTSNNSDLIDAPIGPSQRLALSAATHAVAIGEEDARQSLLSIASVVNAMSKLPGERAGSA